MLSLFRRLRRPCARRSRSIPMHTEVLCSRIMLTSEFPADDLPADDLPADDPPVENFAPYIWGDDWTTSRGTTVEISGWVMDEHPEGLIVTFSGVVSGTTTTDGFGGFSLITDISALGPIYATVVDAGGLVGSDEVFFLDAAPDINDFSVLQLGPNEWVLRGTVVDEAPVGLIVTFGGVVPGGLTAVVEADGTFERYLAWRLPLLMTCGPRRPIWLRVLSSFDVAT